MLFCGYVGVEFLSFFVMLCSYVVVFVVGGFCEVIRLDRVSDVDAFFLFGERIGFFLYYV